LANPTATAAADALVRATVVVAAGDGHGSGVFIAEDPAGGGWVLTNAHVVGDAERVRVSGYDRRPQIGTVQRRHRVRDVALVHVPGPVPGVAAVRRAAARVGETVLAVGAPLAETNRNTVTRGIVSKVTRQRLTGLSLIQSDVTIQHGNSGGPLGDSAGTVVGLAVAGLMSPVDRSEGLNLFIPIGDALARLNVVLAGRP
jgi:S1-C subfamily serine protease